ncbi:MAG: Gfo/Idh/MocA family oxidoreductase [Phycisphaeraceae bacterium]
MGRHHVRTYKQMPGADLCAVVDIDEQRVRTVADEFGCAGYTSVDEMLSKHPQVEAVTIAVPTQFHRATAEPLLARRIACLVEKPLAPSVEDARALVESADRHGAVLQVGHTERFNPAVRAAEALNFKARFLEVDRVSPMTFRSLDVGVVMDMMIHDLDIVLMLARSPIKSVHAAGVAVLGKHEDVASVRIVFENGCVANITASRLALKTERKLRVFSENGYISLNYQTRNGIVIHTAGDNIEALTRIREQVAQGKDLSDLDYHDIIRVQELTFDVPPGEEDQLTAEQTSFLRAVRGGSPPAVDGAAGYAAVDAAERVVRAIKEHTWEGMEGSTLLLNNAERM